MADALESQQPQVEESEEQQPVKEKKPRKPPTLKEPVLLGTDAKGRNVYQGPFKGTFVTSTSKNGKERKNYMDVEITETGELITKPKAKKSGSKKRKITEVATDQEESVAPIVEEKEEKKSEPTPATQDTTVTHARKKRRTTQA